MKCPNDGSELAPGKRHGVEVAHCGSCAGSWLTPRELDQLENVGFDLGDEEKGSLVFSSTPNPGRKCPECGEAMRSFAFRLYDLELEFCEGGHGYWLDGGEDDRVIELMMEEEARVKRSGAAEHQWTSLLGHLRSGSFIEKLKDLIR
jgi:Zn-finger nucleic acid-binding protein